jgi:integrase
VKLDAKTVASLALAPGKLDTIYFDSAMPGFGLRLRMGAAGRLLRSWVVQYRHAGANRRLLLGSAEVLGAEQARTAAKKVLAQVALGADPQADRSDRRSKDRLSLRSVIDQYLAGKKARPRTFYEVRRYLTGDYFRSLHGRPIDQVHQRDIAARLVVLEREAGTATARKARAALSALYVWAMRSGLMTSNPAIGTPVPANAPSRERVLTDDELARIWRSCGDDDHGRIIRLLILTGARRSEIGGMAWSEIDFGRGVWTLAAARSKNHRPHTLMVMPMMQQILDTVPHMASRDQLFGFRGAGFTSWSAAKARLNAASGVTGWNVHDIRRSVATRMADLGVQPHIIEQVLNHQSGHKRGPAGIYNRSSYEREVRAALALWHDHVRAIAGGGERKVLPFAPGQAN